MIQDLPKTVPPVVLAAVQETINAADEIALQRRAVKDIYTGDGYRRWAQVAREHVMSNDLLVKAQAIVDWGVTLRDALPTRWLCDNRFRTDPDFGPCLTVVRHEIILASREGFPGGRLTTELDLVLDATEGLYRHHEWFDSYRMTGGGLLNSASGLHLALHPEMLSRIHGIIAEGVAWQHVAHGLNRLIESFKDR